MSINTFKKKKKKTICNVIIVRDVKLEVVGFLGFFKTMTMSVHQFIENITKYTSLLQKVLLHPTKGEYFIIQVYEQA